MSLLAKFQAHPHFHCILEITNLFNHLLSYFLTPLTKKPPPKKAATLKRVYIKEKNAPDDDSSSGPDTEKELDDTIPTSGSITVHRKSLIMARTVSSS